MLSHGRWIAVGAALGVGALLGLWMLAASTGAEAEAEAPGRPQLGAASSAGGGDELAGAPPLSEPARSVRSERGPLAATDPIDGSVPRTGRVFLPGGGGLAEAAVVRIPGAIPLATTGADGRFTIEAPLADGEVLHAVREGYVTAGAGVVPELSLIHI